jgi:endonuclease-3
MPISAEAIAQRNKTFKQLEKLHPNAWTELIFSNTFELLIAVILSAQATDKLVNAVTPGLFKKYPTSQKLAKATVTQIDKAIGRVNFHSTKARNIKAAANKLVDDFNGEVPQTGAELITLAGVGRKTANVVLGHGFGKAEGIPVDTHVLRLANRLGWTEHDDPLKVEQDLMKLFPKKKWILLSDLLILHGRTHCKARFPKCENCGLFEPFCPSQKHS